MNYKTYQARGLYIYNVTSTLLSFINILDKL